MPYKDKAKQREYQNNWTKRRRTDWIESQGGKCIVCDNDNLEELEVDHIDPSLKFTHRIWTYRQEIRDKELSNCQVLCVNCHRQKTYDQNYVKDEVPF